MKVKAFKQILEMALGDRVVEVRCSGCITQVEYEFAEYYILKNIDDLGGYFMGMREGNWEIYWKNDQGCTNDPLGIIPRGADEVKEIAKIIAMVAFEEE